jgi:hypothetical protein
MYHFALSGILMEAPYLDHEGYLIFKLGIPDEENNEYDIVIYKTEPPINRDEGVRYGGLTYVEKSPDGGYRISTIFMRSESMPLDEALEIYEDAVGKQTTLVFVFGLDIEDVTGYFRDSYDDNPDCEEACIARIERTIENFDETLDTFRNLLYYNLEFDGGIINALPSITYIPFDP